MYLVKLVIIYYFTVYLYTIFNETNVTCELLLIQKLKREKCMEDSVPRF